MKKLIFLLLITSELFGQQELFHAQNKGLLLDEYPNAAAAYSLRRVNSRYTGALIRVRRDSTGQAEQDIGSIGEALDTVALKAFIRNNSGYVTTWYDQSGNARNATQTTAASQPRIVNAGAVDKLNGKPAMYLDGSNDFLEVPSSTATFNFLHNGTKSFVSWVGRAGITSNPNTLYFIISNIQSNFSEVGYAFWLDDRSPTYNNAISTLITRGNASNYTGNLLQNNVFTPNIQSVVTTKIDLNNLTSTERITIKINNSAEIKATNVVNPPSTANATLNLFFGRYFGVSTMLGNFQETIFFNTDQTTTRTQIEQNINSYYAIY